jgi:NDP-sugar pyrophosphorylase family protein
MKAADFFTLPRSLAPFLAAFQADAPPWEWLKQVSAALATLRLDQSLKLLPAGPQVEGWVYVHPSVKIPSTAMLIGPAWIGANTQIRPGAYIRGNVIVGEGCVLGNSCEFKNCLLMDGVQVPHFSYVGDSILGNGVHLGAGAVLSNFRLDKQPIVLRLPDLTVETGLRKFGAILGDNAEVGCNAVLQPGTLLGPRALVMPAMAFGGWLPPATIAKVRQSVTMVPRRD